MQNLKLENLLLIDIETVPAYPDYQQLTEEWKNLWAEKIRHQLPADSTPETFYKQRAGIIAEFAKVVCVSMGYFRVESKSAVQLRIKSFYGDDEKALLLSMLYALKELEAVNSKWNFTGHNIREFDIPFLCRRLLVNSIQIPGYLDFQNMKPWDVNLADTFQFWRFGDHKNYTSLKLLAATLGLPSPKEDMDGSMVADIYYRQHELERIVAYCQQDVITVANIVRRFRNESVLSEEQIVVVRS